MSKSALSGHDTGKCPAPTVTFKIIILTQSQPVGRQKSDKERRVTACSLHEITVIEWRKQHVWEKQDMHKQRQAMYVERNIEVRSRNHCCRGKSVIIS